MDKELILSSHYFPCIAYFVYLVKQGTATIDMGEYYNKQSYRNRCTIYSAQGPLDLVIPVIKSSRMALKDVCIEMKNNWKSKHWRAICAAYNSSPFFEYYSIELKNVFFNEEKKLSLFNSQLLDHICGEMGIDTKVNTSNIYINSLENQVDLRSSLHPKKNFKYISTYPKYTQTFESIDGFLPNLSILDLLFNEGPESINFLQPITED
tara:strand:- start:1643 stop:2266 length:624 start_codon:yes stop_codon:yes gene_type:complete